jgi:hypothetical protein
MASSSHAPGTRSVFSGSESVRCPRRNPDKVWPKLSGGPSPVRYHPRSIKAFTSSYSGSVSRSVNVSLWTTPVSWSCSTHEGPLCVNQLATLRCPTRRDRCRRNRDCAAGEACIRVSDCPKCSGNNRGLCEKRRPA